MMMMMMCIQQGKSYPFKGSFPFMWNPIVVLDFNNLWRTMDQMGEEVKHESPFHPPLFVPPLC